VARPWWAKFAGAVRPSTVVVANILREHCTQVPLADDQYAVGEFGSRGADKPFGDTVRPRTLSRNPDHLGAHLGQDSIKRRGEPASPVADEEPELGGRNLAVDALALRAKRTRRPRRDHIIAAAPARLRDAPWSPRHRRALRARRGNTLARIRR
jgi:hypothetical protein